MTKHAVVDIETGGKKAGCIVFSVGITIFDGDKMNSFDELRAQGIEVILNTKVQVDKGLAVDPRTMAWWAKQGPEAQKVINPDNPLDPEKFYSLVESIGTPYSFSAMKWYARGPTFDMTILEAMLEKFGVSPPWKYWAVRDSRTVYDEHNIDYLAVENPDDMILHNALDDAAWDAYMLQRTWNNPDEMKILMSQLFRCGYCGACCDKDGNVLNAPTTDADKKAYEHAKPVQGLCCAGEIR